MAQQNNQQNEPPVNKEKTFWGSLSLGQKLIFVLVIVSFVVIIGNVVLGGINSFWELVFFIFFGLGLAVVAYLVLWAGEVLYRPKFYSPKEDHTTKLVNTAISHKPDNLQDLYFQGSDWKKAVHGGKIVGCLGLPYYVGKPILDENGKQKFVEDQNGKKIPVFDKLTVGEEGETFFIYEKGGLLNKKRFLFRCRRDFHSVLNGDVVIYSINPVPHGKYGILYPVEQIQEEPQRILVQSQIEAIMQTHEHQSDLISQAADSGIYFNPYFKMVEKTNAEISKDGQ